MRSRERMTNPKKPEKQREGRQLRQWETVLGKVTLKSNALQY